MDQGQTLRIVYVGWVGFGNLGDDVCRNLFTDHIGRSAFALGRDCVILTATHQGISEQALLEFRPHLVVLGAGSLFTPAYLQPLLVAQKHGIPTATWGTGFDKLSRPSLDALLETKAPLPLWHNERDAEPFRWAVDTCTWAGVRGPHTLKILESAGCASPHLHISGDPGLLLQPGDAPEPLEPRLQSWINDRAPIVAVNWGTANNHVYGGDERMVAAALSQVIEQLSRDSYKVLLFSVWGPDLAPMRKLAAPFDDDPNVVALRQVPSGPALAWILKRCRFSINFKLHANVFTAAVGRPFISLAYRSKCYDFAASVGCDDLVVRFDRPDLSEAVMDACDLIEQNRKALKARIRNHARRYTKRLNTLIEKMAAVGRENA